MEASIQAAMNEEQQRHDQRMSALQQQFDALTAVLADQQQNFHELVDRVARLRVARAEYLSAKAQGTLQQHRFNTGSAAADAVLYAIQDKVTAAHATGGADSLLNKLFESAKTSVTLQMAGQAPGARPPAAAPRTTNIVVITRPDVRGVRAWARRHMASNPAFADDVHRRTPAWEPYRYDHMARGLALVPGLHAIPNKTFRRLNVCLLRERSMQERTDERTLDILRVTTILKTTEKATGRPLTDATQIASAVQAVCQTWIARLITELQEAVRTSAPWNQPGAGNDQLSGAVDMLLYSVVPRATVRALQSPAGHEGCSLLQLDMTVSAPLHVSAIDPLLELLWRRTEREYICEHILLPLIAAIGGALGQEADAVHYGEISLAFLSGLLAIAQSHNLVAPDDTSASGAASRPAAATAPVTQSIRDRLYHVLLSLALAQSTMEIDVAVPQALTEASQYAASASGVKRQASRWLQALLRNFISPTPYTIPPLTDAATIDVAIKLLRVPTEFLEILNRTFSSNQRLPSTSRNSILDAVVTPQSKISLGLKLYSELVLEVYRPFSRAAGIVVASENGSQGRPRAPPGVPVIELAADTVSANEAVAAQAAAWMKTLQDEENAPAPEMPSNVRTAFTRFTEKWEKSALLAELQHEVGAMSPAVRIDGHYASYIDVLLPFGLSQQIAQDARKALLYVHISAL